MRRTALEIKKNIISLLKGKEISLRELETKLDTSNLTVKRQLEELSYLGIVELIHHKKNPINGRPYTTARLKKFL